MSKQSPFCSSVPESTHRRMRFLESMKTDIKIGLQRRKTAFTHLTLLLLPTLASYMMYSGDDERQTFVKEFKPFVCHEKEAWTVSALKVKV